MSRCVPSWDLEDVNPVHDIFRLEYEVAELKWENGHLALHELGSRRVPSKSRSTTSNIPKYTWEKPRAAETLEAIVNQATLQTYCKTHVAVDDEDELVPWLNNHSPTAAAGSVNASASATMTSDALVPSSNNRTDVDVRSGEARRSITSARDGGCSTRVGSCSGDPSAFVDRRVAFGGGGGVTTSETHDWRSCRDHSVSESGTFATLDTYDGDLDGRRLTSTSENTSSGKEFSKSTSPVDSVSHRRSQREASIIKENKKVKANSSISNKRRRTPAIHNQSERKRRDKINQRMKMLQKLVPNSSKTDKASMLEEIIEYVKQLQAYVHMINRMNMSSMMMPLAMQQQQMQMSMMNSMGMGMGMGIGMDMNTIAGSNIPIGFHPSTFMHMPSWNGLPINRTTNTTALPTDPMYTFLGCQSQPMNMDAYSRMVALYQHMQNQPCAPISKN